MPLREYGVQILNRKCTQYLPLQAVFSCSLLCDYQFFRFIANFDRAFLEIWIRLGQNRSLLDQTRSEIPHDQLPLPRNEIQQSLVSFGVKLPSLLRLAYKQFEDFFPRKVLVDYWPDILMDVLSNENAFCVCILACLIITNWPLSMFPTVNQFYSDCW
jgi:hypothetical protein